MNDLLAVRVVTVPRQAVDALATHLRSVGEQGHEGLGLWVGLQDGVRFAVHATLIPVQRHIRTADGVCVVVGADELHKINVWLYRQKLTLFAQIHSHPGRAYHSSTDDANAVATTRGCLSVVVPDFASAPFDMRRNATYRLDPGGRWRAVSAAEAARMIIVEG